MQIKERKNKSPSFSQNLKEYSSNYANHSSVHGLKFLGERKRSKVERLFWLIIIIISLYFTSKAIIQIYAKWNNGVIAFTQIPTSVRNISFPAITICPQDNFKQTSFNYTYYYHFYQEGGNLTDEELRQFEDISMLCNPSTHEEGQLVTDSDVVDFYEEVA
ncbi:Amiloride-sensitive sodium channel [Popillia japonica]|uniref:Amiloride-sensitive sodium channel n=1 Tax=Popillia japonica TaxID=7064 RepID=A0AAW1JY94_POPJA